MTTGDQNWTDETFVLGAVLAQVEDLDAETARRVLLAALETLPRAPRCSWCDEEATHVIAWNVREMLSDRACHEHAAQYGDARYAAVTRTDGTPVDPS